MLSPNNINQDPICWEKLEMLRLKLLFQVRLLPISTQLPHPPQNICIDESVSWDFRIGFGGEGFFFLFLHINIVLYVWELLSVQEVKKTPNKLGRKGHSCAKLAMNRCNVDYYTCAHYSGGMLYQKNQVATDDISQENTRMHTERRPWTNEVDLFNISDFFPQKIGLWGQSHWHQICLRFFSKCTYSMNLKFHISQVIMFKRFSENLISYLDLEV